MTSHRAAPLDASAPARLLGTLASGKIVFLACLSALGMLGVGLLTPTAKFTAIAVQQASQDSAIHLLERRVDTNDRLLRSNNAAWCVTLSPRDAKLAQLDCSQVGR